MSYCHKVAKINTKQETFHTLAHFLYITMKREKLFLIYIIEDCHFIVIFAEIYSFRNLKE